MDRLKFTLERLLLRGAHYRLLFMAACVVLVAVGGGWALTLIGEPESSNEAVWWAFLRLTDPGYLGDDEGLGRRVLSTGITVLGYVLFMGALIAILTQWLHETVERLQRGETPIFIKDHLLVLGLTERTPLVLEELLRSEARVRRFLSRRGSGARLVLVVLVEDLSEDIRADLADRLGELWNDRSIILRSGSPLLPEHLHRVDFARASAILVPGGNQAMENQSERDAVTIKTVLSIANHNSVRALERAPRLVAEVYDERLLDVVEADYPGALELIPNESVVSRLIAQNLRHRGLSWLLGELLAFHHGNDLFYREFESLHGKRFDQAVLRIQGGVPLGVVRRSGRDWTPHLNPPPDFVLDRDDRWVVISDNRDGITVGPPRTPPEPIRDPPPELNADWPSPRRVLLLGWSRRIPPLLNELSTYDAEEFHVDIVSVLSAEERERFIEQSGVNAGGVSIRQMEGDYTNVRDLSTLDLAAYHNLVIMGRGWLEEGEVSDAQTILCYSIVQSMLKGLERRPSVLVELMDPDNSGLFDERPGELVLSPVLMSHMLAHVALRPELFAVVHELFTMGGAEFHFRPPAHYGLQGRTCTFAELQREGLARRELVVGVRLSVAELDVRGDLELAPPSDRSWTLTEDTLLLVLTTHQVSSAAS